MNNSVMHFAPVFLTLLALWQAVKVPWQFGFAGDIIRLLGFTFWLLLATLFGVEALGWWGIYLLFQYPTLYETLIAALAMVWVSYVFLGVLERPTQLHRKIVWRLPIFGALLGHFVGQPLVSVLLLLSCSVAIYLVLSSPGHRYVLRALVLQTVCGLLVWLGLKLNFPWIAWIMLVMWILITHRIVNAFLVKNRLRAFNPQTTSGASS